MTTEHRISKEVEFDAGHRVARHDGKCSSPHGHRYLLRVTCEGDIIDDPTSPEHGMLVDFGHLRDLLGVIEDRWDHAFIVDKADADMLAALSGHGWKVAVIDRPPTAENLAAIAFDELDAGVERRWPNRQLRVVEVAVRETPTSWATATRGTPCG